MPALTMLPRHDLTPMEIDAIEDRLYEHNSAATGRDDGEGLGFAIRDDDGRTVALGSIVIGRYGVCWYRRRGREAKRHQRFML